MPCPRLAPVARSALLVAALTAFAPAVARSGDVYRVDPERTSVAFAVTQLGVFEQNGRFGRVHGRILYDPGKESGSVDLVVDTNSVDTGWDLRDRFIESTNMLDAANHPQLEFRSTAMSFVAHRLVAIEGALTLRGVTRPVRFDVRSLRCGPAPSAGDDRCEAKIVGRISRRAFGVDYGYPLVGDDVQLTFAVSAERLPADIAGR